MGFSLGFGLLGFVGLGFRFGFGKSLGFFSLDLGKADQHQHMRLVFPGPFFFCRKRVNAGGFVICQVYKHGRHDRNQSFGANTVNYFLKFYFTTGYREDTRSAMKEHHFPQEEAVSVFINDSGFAVISQASPLGEIAEVVFTTRARCAAVGAALIALSKSESFNPDETLP